MHSLFSKIAFVLVLCFMSERHIHGKFIAKTDDVEESELKDDGEARLARNIMDTLLKITHLELPQNAEEKSVESNEVDSAWPEFCKTPRCVDYVVADKNCCPTCPTGPNCWMKNQIIPANQHVISGAGGCQTICKCPYEEDYISHKRNTRATCVDMCG